MFIAIRKLSFKLSFFNVSPLISIVAEEITAVAISKLELKKPKIIMYSCGIRITQFSDLEKKILPDLTL